MKSIKLSRFTTAICATLALTGAASAQASDEQKSVLEANFQTADSDGDGVLNRDEFKAFINANAENNLGRAKQIRRFKAYGRAFSRLDADGNKAVTLAEIQNAQSGE